MSATKDLRVRRSIYDLQMEYDRGNKQPLEDLVRAWVKIKNLPPTDKRSLFVLGGYHGEPFQYRKAVDDLSSVDGYTYWGGYCNHGNVLFPTWHRVYLLKLEDALQSMVPGVTMPYWDETSEESRKRGIPSILTQAEFELDGETINNPFRSFVVPVALTDFEQANERLWEKPNGYETVRYPLSGLVGTAEARAATQAHNARYPDPIENIKYLNQNIVTWLTGTKPEISYDPNPKPSPPEPPSPKNVYAEYQNCLRAPNYTVFSNTTSAAQWNLDHPVAALAVTPLESPHNDIHLAIGGFDMPSAPFQFEAGKITGANGDMGENNTAAMDPIFFFHHCHVDRMFWLWQKQNGFTDQFDILTGYAGTSSSDSQGPTPGIAPGTPLDMDTPLNPFVKDLLGTVYTSKDCINIETQLGYTYAPGSLEEKVPDPQPLAGGFSTRKLTVRGVDRAVFQGSFVLYAYAEVVNNEGKSSTYYLGHHSVLSRRNLIKCANCLTHLEVIAHFPLSSIPADLVDGARYYVTVQHRGEKSYGEFKYTCKVTN
jgi:tyrosinase